jgi:hypothetical protein
MNPKIIFDFIGKKRPKYKLENNIGSPRSPYFNPRLIQFMDEPTEEHKKHLLRHHPELFHTIKNPSIELQLFAIKRSYNPINDFTNRYEDSEGNMGDLEIDRWFDLNSYPVRLELVRKNPRMIAFIDDPEEGLKLEAVTLKPESIKYIPEPTEEVQMIAVTENGILIKDIVNPSEQVQLASIEKDINAFFLIDKPTEKVKKRFEYLTGQDNND